MTPSRTIIESAIVDACRGVATEGAAFAIGSYSSAPVAVEEFDFVVVLPESKRALFPSLARRLADNFVARAGDVAVRLATHFVPRSYEHELTLHGAFYTHRDLVERRPRILSALNDDTRIWGDQSFVPREAGPRTPYLDLIFGRWGLLHALTILHDGGWTVPMWNCRREPPIMEEVGYRLSVPCVFPEFVWYFASKLTANALSDIHRCESSCSPLNVQEALERIRHVILATRNRTTPPVSHAAVMRLWRAWVCYFEGLLAAAMAEDRNRLHAASHANSSP